MPNKPIELPESYATLPAPTPGGQNRADATPLKDAVAALGGNPSRLDRSGQITADQGLVSHATRFGVASGIRQQLAAEDLEFRRDNKGRILERLANLNMYYKAYSDQSLDQYAELRRFRQAGVPTPSAPPDPAAD